MTHLLDRDSELSKLAETLDVARAGRGAVVVIGGPPGIGKTAVLDELCSLAEGRGFRSLRAVGGEFEREYAFGVARQLVEPVLLTTDGMDDRARGTGAVAMAHAALGPRARGGPGNDYEVFHSLYWLCAHLADASGVVIAVDDAHWADATSLEWLRYLTRRIDELAALVVLSVRSDQVSTASAVLADIIASAASVELVLPPLGATGTGSILERVLKRELDAAFRDAAHRATGGNPFLVTELGRAMLGEGIEPRGEEAWRIGSLRAQAIVRSIDTRLRRLSSGAQALAQAAAVFGVEAEFRHAAALAGLDVEEAVAAADELHGAWIVRAVDPLRFEHSVTRDAILAELSPARLARDHKRAADALAGEKASAERVAGHLLLSTPVGDPGSARWLHTAAEEALNRGAPASAIVYLDRALIEPPAPSDRWSLLHMLGRAKRLSALPGAVDDLRLAYEGCGDRTARPDIAISLAGALSGIGRAAEAYRLLEHEIVVAGQDRELALSLEAHLLAVAQLSHEVAGWARQRAEKHLALAGTTVGERAVLANVAYIRSNDGAAHEEVLGVARRAFNDGRDLDSFDEATPFLGWLARVFMNFGELEPGQAILSHSAERARVHGSVSEFGFALLVRAALSYTVGDIAATAEDTDAALRLVEESGLRPLVPALTALRIAAHIETGELDEAVGLLERLNLTGAIPPLGVFDQLLFFRGAVRGALGDTEAALADLFELGVRERTAGYHFVVTQWRVAAAPLLAGDGRSDEARALLAEELDVGRRRGSPKPIAVALRALAGIEGRVDEISLLTESASLLEPTPFRLEAARSAVALGAALRRANHRSEARVHLERGLDGAVRCGALVLAESARTELAAAGARPRRDVVSGPESLTASERRVAELAAQGLSNPQIAQALFVTRKTVETHLGRVYPKLAITGRGELAAALAKNDR